MNHPYWISAVEIREDQEQYVVSTDLPGVDPNEIEVTVENGMLTIRGERGDRRFHRRFVLPDSVDAERISASGRHGVLTVTIPKHERVQPRRIAVTQ